MSGRHSRPLVRKLRLRVRGRRVDVLRHVKAVLECQCSGDVVTAPEASSGCFAVNLFEDRDRDTHGDGFAFASVRLSHRSSSSVEVT